MQTWTPAEPLEIGTEMVFPDGSIWRVVGYGGARGGDMKDAIPARALRFSRPTWPYGEG
jgi:hypothetical protein